MKKQGAATSASASLVIPCLLDAETVAAFPKAHLHWLEKHLGRADRLALDGNRGLEPCLFGLFGAEIPVGADLPVAALTRVHDMGVIDGEWWMRADPVYLIPRRDDVIMAPLGEVGLSQDEANALIDEIMAVFADDGWILRAPHPGRWYLRPGRVPDIRTTPLPEVVGRSIESLLPTGPDAGPWRTVLNELQILLHTASTNAAREARGAAPVNSLWFWGGGRLPGLRESAWTRVWADEPSALALARLAQVPSGPLPEHVAESLVDAGPGRHLLVVDRLDRARLQGDADAWFAATQAVVPQVLQPLVDRLKGGELDRLDLYPCAGGGGFSLSRSTARRWWRRSLRLAGATPS